MTGLAATDLRAALEFALVVRATDDLESFRRHLVPGLRRLIACHTVGITEIDLERGTATSVTDAAAQEGIEQRFLELAPQHPLIPYQQAGDGQARRISDFLSLREFRRLELYQDIYRPLGVEDQLAFGIGGEAIVGIHLTRGRRTFTERDRELVELLRPHLARAYARARERERAEVVLKGLASEIDDARAGVIKLDGLGRIAYATRYGSELLQRYFRPPPAGPSGLPARLQAWLEDPHRTDSAPRKLSIRGAGGRLVVSEHDQSPSDGVRTLILEERTAGPPTVVAIRSLGLTCRQAQVLRLLACGRATGQIASDLGIAPATVEKHLENTYARLGVNGRTQALALIYDHAGSSVRRPAIGQRAKNERHAWPALADRREHARRAPRADLKQALSVVLAAQAAESVEQLRDELLPALRRLVPCDLIGYNDIDLEQGAVVGIIHPAEGGFDGIEERFAAVADQHPLVRRQQTGDLSTQAMSDFLTARRFHRLALYHDFYKLIDAEDQLAFGVPGDGMVAFALCRARRNFTWRDRELLELVRPHLSLAYRHAREREASLASIRSLEEGLEALDRGLIVLDSRGRVAHATVAARELLDTFYHPTGDHGDGLPPRLLNWLAATPDPASGAIRQLTIHGPRGRLRIREQEHAPPDGSRILILEEQRPRPPSLDALRSHGLTPRQAQVLRLLACGKSNRQIGNELHISLATVEKHLERIYTRLEVGTRTQAIARIHR